MWVDVDNVFKAWFVCKPLIEDCIASQLNNCQQICRSESLYFTPNLTVGNPDSHFHGVYFDPKKIFYILKWPTQV